MFLTVEKSVTQVCNQNQCLGPEVTWDVSFRKMSTHKTGNPTWRHSKGRNQTYMKLWDMQQPQFKHVWETEWRKEQIAKIEVTKRERAIKSWVAHIKNPKGKL